MSKKYIGAKRKRTNTPALNRKRAVEYRHRPYAVKIKNTEILQEEPLIVAEEAIEAEVIAEETAEEITEQPVKTEEPVSAPVAEAAAAAGAAGVFGKLSGMFKGLFSRKKKEEPETGHSGDLKSWINSPIDPDEEPAEENPDELLPEETEAAETVTEPDVTIEEMDETAEEQEENEIILLDEPAETEAAEEETSEAVEEAEAADTETSEETAEEAAEETETDESLSTEESEETSEAEPSEEATQETEVIPGEETEAAETAEAEETAVAEKPAEETETAEEAAEEETAEVTAEAEEVPAEEEPEEKLTRKEKRELRKEIRKETKTQLIDEIIDAPRANIFVMLLAPGYAMKRVAGVEKTTLSAPSVFILNLLKWGAIGTYFAMFIEKFINIFNYSFIRMNFTGTANLAFRFGIFGFVFEYLSWILIGIFCGLIRKKISTLKLMEVEGRSAPAIALLFVIGCVLLWKDFFSYAVIAGVCGIVIGFMTKGYGMDLVLPIGKNTQLVLVMLMVIASMFAAYRYFPLTVSGLTDIFKAILNI